MRRPTGLPGFFLLAAAWGGHAPLASAQDTLGSHLAGASADPCMTGRVAAVAAARGGELAAADRHLGSALELCPGDRGLRMELAGLRFRQGRYADAAAAAEVLAREHPDDPPAWELLAASRFLLGDQEGALRAWNRLGRPLVVEVRAEGSPRAPRGSVEAALGMAPGDLLTPEALALSRRRIAALPSVARSRVDFLPREGGTALLEVVVQPRPLHPGSPAAAAGHGLRALASGRLSIESGGPLSRGERWSADLGWREHRRGLALGLAVPAPAGPGSWAVEARRESGAYAPGPRAEPDGEGRVSPPRGDAARETRTGLAFRLSDWQSGRLHWTGGGSFERWRDRGAYWGLAAGLEHRTTDERRAVRIDGASWWPIASGEDFRRLSVRARLRSPPALRGFEWEAGANAVRAGTRAPPDLWAAAGADHAADVRLRARPLLDRDGAARGPFLGPTLVHATVEGRRWLGGRGPLRAGLGGFVDAARVWPAGEGDPPAAALDAGGGIRAAVPGVPGFFRADLAFGLSDGARAVSFGWSTAWPGW